MKIGDTFIQDGIKYKVVDENESGLISKVVTEEEKEIKEEPIKRRRKTEV